MFTISSLKKSLLGLLLVALHVSANPLPKTHSSTLNNVNPLQKDLLFYSTLMHHSDANYCPSTDQTVNWQCRMTLLLPLSVLDPKVKSSWIPGQLDRCADDYTYTSSGDGVGSFQPFASQLDGKTQSAFYMGLSSSSSLLSSNDPINPTQPTQNSNERSLIVSFRGSQSIQSVLLDLEFWETGSSSQSSSSEGSPSVVGGYRVHTGFYNAYLIIKDKVANSLTSLLSSSSSQDVTSIIFTGHSLGGVLALFAAVDFLHASAAAGNTIPPVRVVTFGEPRSGDEAWSGFAASMLGQSHTRIAFLDDVVPKLPPIFLGYLHTGYTRQLSGSYSNPHQYSLTTFVNGTVGDVAQESEEQSLWTAFENAQIDLITLLSTADGGEGLVDLLVGGLYKHITHYFGYWTYPPEPILTLSGYC